MFLGPVALLFKGGLERYSLKSDEKCCAHPCASRGTEGDLVSPLVVHRLDKTLADLQAGDSCYLVPPSTDLAVSRKGQEKGGFSRCALSPDYRHELSPQTLNV